MMTGDLSFRPLSGNLLSLPFLTVTETALCHMVFVPYRGIYFLYKEDPHNYGTANVVFVPYRGIYFLYWTSGEDEERVEELFSSPIGESTFSTL